jgi:large subunit ribosomal protein L15
MNLSTLSPRPGSKHRVKRLGCGESSGHGKTCGRGHKGQKARAGTNVRHGFEGGQMPIYRRLPKKGFSHVDFAIRYAVVNVGTLNDRFEANAEVTEDALRALGLVKGHSHKGGIKILGDGEITKPLTITVNKVTASAKEKIEKAGGKVTDPAPAAK